MRGAVVSVPDLVATDLRARVEGVRERARDLAIGPEDAAELAADATRRGRALGWRGVRLVTQVLLVVPRLLVQLLEGLGRTATRAVDRGEEAAELAGSLAHRAREVAGAVPGPLPQRPAERRRALAWLGVAFGIGLAVGWSLGRRQAGSAATSADPPDTLVPGTEGAATSPNGHAPGEVGAAREAAGSAEDDERG